MAGDNASKRAAKAFRKALEASQTLTDTLMQPPSEDPPLSITTLLGRSTPERSHHCGSFGRQLPLCSLPRDTPLSPPYLL